MDTINPNPAATPNARPDAEPGSGPGLTSDPNILTVKTGRAIAFDPSAGEPKAKSGARSSTRSYSLAAVFGNVPAADDAAARVAWIRRETDLKNLISEALKVTGHASPAPGLTFMRDSGAMTAKATAAQHDLIADAISAQEKKSRPAASPKREKASPSGGALITRLYSLKALITKAPAKIDDDAHNKRAADAYQAKVEALLGWVKTVLAHSEPAEASFEFSPEAGAFVVKATEAQHDALMQSAAIFEDNYGK